MTDLVQVNPETHETGLVIVVKNSHVLFRKV